MPVTAEKYNRNYNYTYSATDYVENWQQRTEFCSLLQSTVLSLVDSIARTEKTYEVNPKEEQPKYFTSEHLTMNK